MIRHDRNRSGDDGLSSDVAVTPRIPSPIAEARGNTPSWRRLVHTEAKLLVSLGFHVLPIKRLAKGYAAAGFNANSASNNPKKVDEWFDPDTGKFAGGNLAIACGAQQGVGVVVADADRHGKGDGVKEWIDLVQTHGTPDKHPWAKTPNDGEHHLFQWDPALTRKSAPGSSGLEVLGGENGTFKSFVLVYPSVVENREGHLKQYQWQVHPKECRPPHPPDWLTEAFAASRQKPRGTNRGNEEVTDRDLEPVIPKAQIERMLAAVDPDRLSYDEWLSIGMAIHSQHQDAIQLWDDWSKQGTRYKPDECTKRWKGFRAAGLENRVTIGTLFFHAKDAGWRPEPNDTFCDEVSLAIAELNKTYAHVVVGGQERILRLLPDHDPTELHYDLLSPRAFQRLFPGQYIRKPSWRKSKKLPDAWLDSPYRRSYARGIQLRPNEETAPNVFNTWDGFAYEAIEGDCSLFFAHVRDILCKGNEQHFNWLLDWCADCVQDPSNLKGTSVVLQGKEGTGKGTFADTIGKLFGPHYVHLIDASHLLGNFNAHLMEAILVFADEITYGGNAKTDGKLKGLVTERRLTGERKGIDAVQYRNYAHVVIASNGEWVIRSGGNSRRWFVLEVADSRANDRAYFDAIHEQLANGGYEALLYELQNRNITSNLRFAPETEALAEQRRLSAEGRAKFVEYLEHRLTETCWSEHIFVDHADYGKCLVKSAVYTDYCCFVERLKGNPWGAGRFWTQWLRVFSYARGNQSDWPRTRPGPANRLTRVAVVGTPAEACAAFQKFYGSEVVPPDHSWLPDSEGI